MKRIILILLIFCFTSFSQSKDPNVILNKVKEKFNTVKDYVVDVKIKIDVEFIKAPVTEAKIYFKQPDKIHFESENFALLPKEGINFSPSALLKDNYTAVYSKEDTVDGFKTSVVKVIPLNEQSKIVLTTLWIDQKDELIRKIETTAKTGGTFSIELKYNNNFNYPLPSHMEFNFNVDRMNIPQGINSDLQEDKKRSNGEKRSGKVIIDYSNYKINEGIPDRIFEEKK